MWRTTSGDRPLTEPEWDLFKEGLIDLWDWLGLAGDDDPYETGVRAFDVLQVGQKEALLALVASALHDPRVAPPRLTAHTEAAVAAVFGHVRDCLTEEIDASGDGPITFWRERVLTACRGVGEPTDELPAADSDDAEEWDLLLECLEDQILWDRDHEMGDLFLDDDPEVARQKMAWARIDPDYFTALAPDPTDQELDAARRLLCGLAGRPVPGEDGLYRGFRDEYHDLAVGPCTVEDVAREAGCSLIVKVWTSDVAGFDCSYGEWVTVLRRDVVGAW